MPKSGDKMFAYCCLEILSFVFFFFLRERSNSLLGVYFMRILLFGLLITLVNTVLLLPDVSLAFVHKVNLKICPAYMFVVYACL